MILIQSWAPLATIGVISKREGTSPHCTASVVSPWWSNGIPRLAPDHALHELALVSGAVVLIVKFPLDHWRQWMITDGRMKDGLSRGYDVFTPGLSNKPPLWPQIACMSTPEYERGGGEGKICQSQSKRCISTCRGTLGASGLYGSHTPLSRYTSASQRRSSDGGRRPSMYVRLGRIV